MQQSVIDWLLEENNPSVRYRTLTELLDRKPDDAQAQEAKAQIPPDYRYHQSCLYAYNLRTFIMLGYRDDPRVQQRADVLPGDVRRDGGYLCDRPSFRAETKSCIRGSIKALTAFAALPELWDTARCKQLIEYFLKRRVFYRMDRPEQVIRGELACTRFPFGISGSLLAPLYALSIMGYGRHPALGAAWAQLETKKDPQGRYLLDWSPPSYFSPGPKGQPNKWTTLYAYLALKYANQPTETRL